MVSIREKEPNDYHNDAANSPPVHDNDRQFEHTIKIYESYMLEISLFDGAETSFYEMKRSKQTCLQAAVKQILFLLALDAGAITQRS